MRRKHFDGDVAAEPRVASPVHLAHAAGADGRDDFVRAEARANEDVHGANTRLYAPGRESERIRGARPRVLTLSLPEYADEHHVARERLVERDCD